MDRGDTREAIQKNIRMLVPIDKSATPQRISYGVVLEPDTEDLQGDVMSAEDIEKAAYDWMERSQTAGHMHSETVGGAKVVESYIAPCDIPVETPEGPETIRKGSWVLGVRWPENIWKRIADGELTGYSVGGTGIRLALEGIDKAGRGRMGGPLAAGPGGECVCPSCGHRESHPTGEPCDDLKCPECGAAMVREEPEDVEKAGKWAPGPNAGWKRTDGPDDDDDGGKKPKKKPKTYHSDELGEVTIPEDDDSPARPEDEERDEELRRSRRDRSLPPGVSPMSGPDADPDAEYFDFTGEERKSLAWDAKGTTAKTGSQSWAVKPSGEGYKLSVEEDGETWEIPHTFKTAEEARQDAENMANGGQGLWRAERDKKSIRKMAREAFEEVLKAGKYKLPT